MPPLTIALTQMPQSDGFAAAGLGRELFRGRNMQSNLEKYKADVNKLVRTGTLLQVAMEYECYPDQVKELYGKDKGGKKLLKQLPNFGKEQA